MHLNRGICDVSGHVFQQTYYRAGQVTEKHPRTQVDWPGFNIQQIYEIIIQFN